MQDHQLLLVPMTKKEIAAAFNMTYHTLWRKIKHLDIPPAKVIPKDILRICECCGMAIERVLLCIKRYNIRQ
jgi:hypothetical protein